MEHLKNIHILLRDDQYEKLKEYYPARGEITNLFSRLVDLVIFQIEQQYLVDTQQIAKAVVEDDKRRGLK